MPIFRFDHLSIMVEVHTDLDVAGQCTPTHCTTPTLIDGGSQAAGLDSAIELLEQALAELKETQAQPEE